MDPGVGTVGAGHGSQELPHTLLPPPVSALPCAEGAVGRCDTEARATFRRLPVHRPCLSQLQASWEPLACGFSEPKVTNEVKIKAKTELDVVVMRVVPVHGRLTQEITWA
jgi:hypothetical protein